MHLPCLMCGMHIELLGPAEMRGYSAIGKLHIMRVFYGREYAMIWLRCQHGGGSLHVANAKAHTTTPSFCGIVVEVLFRSTFDIHSHSKNELTYGIIGLRLTACTYSGQCI